MEDLGLDERIILKWIIENRGWRTGIETMWLRMDKFGRWRGGVVAVMKGGKFF